MSSLSRLQLVYTLRLTVSPAYGETVFIQPER